MTQPQSIRRRLQRLTLLTTGLALALTCVLFISSEWRSAMAFHKQVALRTARITADAVSAMVAFQTRQQAQRQLAAFRVEPQILAAAIYDRTGQRFAEYRAPGSKIVLPEAVRPVGLYSEPARLAVFQPIVEGDAVYGTLYLLTDLRSLYTRMGSYVGGALVIFAAALLGAVLIGRLLQRTISGPILSLAETAQTISRQRDYSVRAQTTEAGELDSLTRAFNLMLEEIQRQQLALAREKELLSTTLASIGDAVIATNENGEVRFLNLEAERLTGWNSSDAVGSPLPSVFRIVDETTRQPAENPVEKVLRAGGVVGLANHTILIAKNGTETPIDDSAAPIRQPNSPLFGVVLVFRDVTEQRKARQNNALLASIVENSGDVILAKTLDGIIQTWNASGERLFGYRADEVVGKSVRILFPPDRFNEEDEIVSRLRQGEPVRRLETIRVTKDGRRIPVALSISPLKDTTGNITGASDVIHNNTELAAVREGLVREKELLATTLASIGDAVIVTNEHREVRFMNREAERLTGWKGSEAEDRPLPLIFHIVDETSRRPADNPVEQVLRRGGVVGLANHTILIAQDGTETPIDDSAAPIRQAEGPLHGVVLVFRDFTERRRLERVLRESEQTHRLLAQIGEVAAQFSDPDDLVRGITERVGEGLGVSHCGFGRVDLGAAEITVTHDHHQASAPSLAGTYSLTFYGDRYAQDSLAEVVTIVENVETDSRTQPRFVSSFAASPVRSFIHVPLHREGQWVAVFWVSHDQPRRWTQAEIASMSLIAERAWVVLQRRETEQALHQAHEELRRHAEELARFNRAAVGRELRIIELKKEINEFCRRAGQSPPYPLQFEKPDERKTAPVV